MGKSEEQTYGELIQKGMKETQARVLAKQKPFQATAPVTPCISPLHPAKRRRTHCAVRA